MTAALWGLATLLGVAFVGLPLLVARDRARRGPR